MKAFPELLGRAVRRLVWPVALVLGLAGCGPGTGGTGTGPGASFYTGSMDGGNQPAAPCSSGCAGALTLVLDAERVQLDLECQRFAYEGQWAFDAQGRVELPGTWQQVVELDGKSTVQSHPVRLSLATGAAGAPAAQVALTVFSLDGRVLLGPVVLQQDSRSASATSCSIS